MTWKKDSHRLCYWCIESPCLTKRIDHEEKNKGIIRGEKERYAEYRAKLDKATQSKCKKSKGINDRREPGAEVFQANILSAHNETDSTQEVKEGRKPNKLHCHESCANYILSCETPMECKQKRLNKEDCPIRKK